MYSYFAVPTEETARRFREILSSSPIRLDFDKMVVRIAMDVQQGVESPEGYIYSGKITWFGQRYNEDLRYAELIGVLDCPELVGRHHQLGGDDDKYEPAVIFQSPATPLAYSNKFFITSVANTLCAREDPFTFRERVLST
jgi:hypothetical protein